MSGFWFDSFTFHRDTRAVASTIGYILILGIVITSSIAIVTTGLVTIDNTRQIAESDSAATAMSQFSSSVNRVASGGGQQAITVAANSNQQVVVSNESRIKIELRNSSSPTTTPEPTGVLLNTTLPAVTYRTEQTLVAYQGGGVWQIDSTDIDGATATEVSPPQFARDGGITLPIITARSTTGFISDDGVMTISNPRKETVYPVAGNETLSNPVEDGEEIALTITSPFYRAWGRTLNSQFQKPVTVDHANESVTIVFTGSSERPPQTRITGIEAGSNIRVTGQSGAVSVDGYDSRVGAQDTTPVTNTTLTSRRGVTLADGVTLNGSVETSGDSVLIGDVTVTNGTAVGGSVITRGGQTRLSGPRSRTVSIDNPGTIDQLIGSLKVEFERNNTNSDSSRISNGQITSGRVLKTTADPTVRAGQYYLSDLTVDDGETVTFDVSSGDVQIVVDGGVTLNDGTVNVTGTAGNNNRVQIFTRSGSVSVIDSTLASPGDDATRVWLYGGRGSRVDMVNSTVTAAVYTPGTADSPSRFTAQSGTTLNGGVVTSKAELLTGASLHHDRALRDTDPFRAGSEIPLPPRKGTPVHISHTTVVLEDS